MSYEYPPNPPQGDPAGPPPGGGYPPQPPVDPAAYGGGEYGGGGGYPPPGPGYGGGYPPQGPEQPKSKKGLIIGLAIAGALILIGGVVTAILLLTGGDDSDDDKSDDQKSDSDDKKDDDKDDDKDTDDDFDLDDGPWIDVVEDFTIAYYDGDCDTATSLAEGAWDSLDDCDLEIGDDDFELEDYTIEGIEVDDESDPTSATVVIDYTVLYTVTDETDEYHTEFTVEKDGKDWVITSFQTD